MFLFLFQVGLIREIPVVEVFRYMEGPKVKGAAPVIVSFKNRKDKEQVHYYYNYY